MKRYLVDFSPEARLHVRAIQAWWTASRPAAPDLFLEELRGAVAKLQDSPNAGTPYRSSSSVAGVRRILMPRTRHHVYYLVTEEERKVRVHAVWHTARERGPELP